MKKLVFIPMLFACLLGMGQAAAGGGKHFIGEKFGGGIVFDISPDGLHGLIAESRDQASECSWNDWYKKNQDIKDFHSSDGKSFSDWRLPDIDELSLMCKKIGPRAPNPLTNIGGFDKLNNGYWSSTSGRQRRSITDDELRRPYKNVDLTVEQLKQLRIVYNRSKFTETEAWFKEFNTGQEGFVIKKILLKVRTIRSF